jgi:hypothetical protein
MSAAAPAAAVCLRGIIVTHAITCSRGRDRVDAYGTSLFFPAGADVPADAEAGRSLMLVASLSADWASRGSWRQALYFTFAF